MWNGPINGNWEACDFTKPPFTGGCAELTHEEVLYVIESLPPIEEEFLPDTNMVISKYNQLSNWEKAINGDTYNVIKGYNPEIHTLGIDANGIIVPVEEIIGEEETPVVEETLEEVIETPIEEV